MTIKTSRNQGGHPTAARAAQITTNVVAATMKAFAGKGSDFSMDEVASLAGVSKQAIYRRWRSKIDLVVDTIDSVLIEAFGRPLATHDDPVAAFEEIAWRSFGTDLVASNRLSIFLQVESFRDARLRERLISWRNRFIDVYRQALLDLEAAGRRAPGDPTTQAEFLMDLLYGGSHKLALLGGFSPAEQRRCFDERWAAFGLIAIR